jgi:hypothetical protein
MTQTIPTNSKFGAVNVPQAAAGGMINSANNSAGKGTIATAPQAATAGVNAKDIQKVLSSTLVGALAYEADRLQIRRNVTAPTA